MPLPPLMMILFLLVKLTSEDLEIGTLDKNKYEDIRGTNVTKQRHGKLLRKILRRRAILLSLKTSPLNL